MRRDEKPSTRWRVMRIDIGLETEVFARYRLRSDAESLAWLARERAKVEKP